MTKASRFVMTALVLALAALIVTPTAEAQRQRRNRQDEHNYDPATVSTITATVREVTAESGRGGAAGVHLILESDDGTTVAHVGPASFMSTNGLSFEAGDEVTLTGSKAVIEDKQALIVREIRSGDTTLVLRDETGLPAWRGQGSRAAEGNPGNGRGPRAAADNRGYGRGAGATADNRGNGRGAGATADNRGYGRGAGATADNRGYGRGAGATADNRGNGRGPRAAEESRGNPGGPRHDAAASGRRRGWKATDAEGTPNEPPRRGNRSCPRRAPTVAGE